MGIDFATSDRRIEATVDRIITVPSCEAARAVAASPPGCAIACIAAGATRIGKSIVNAVETFE